MYRVNFTSEAAKNLASLDKSIAQRILKRLRRFASNFDAISPEPLKAQWGGMFKLRVGDYRVLYTFSKTPNKIITVHRIKHRREVYKI